MDEAFELADHLPLSFNTQAEQEYIAFLWNAFKMNYEDGKYHLNAVLTRAIPTKCFKAIARQSGEVE